MIAEAVEIVRFEDAPHGRLVARLGVVTIGEIATHAGEARETIAWRINLPDQRPTWRGAASIAAARAALEKAALDWIDAAALAPASAREAQIRGFRAADATP